MKAYKVFNEDLKCKDFQYQVGETYTHDGKIELCNSGFHFHKNPKDLFNYYSFDTNNRVCEVEAIGKVEDGSDKSVTDKIRIIRELSWYETLDLINSGKLNTGRGNSGNWNSGNRNSGDQNSGDWNSGDWNSGDWNSGNWNSGFFNSNTPKKIRVFNKWIDREEWDNTEKPEFIYFALTKWIDYNDMTDEERREHPDAATTNGYLKELSYEKAWRQAYDNATKKDIDLLKALPNFDPDVFEEITGIRID
jgi:hypothetical protein